VFGWEAWNGNENRVNPSLCLDGMNGNERGVGGDRSEWGSE